MWSTCPPWNRCHADICATFFPSGLIDACKCQDAPITDGEHTGIILCGQPEMGEAVKAIVEKQGVKEDLILTNF